MKKRSITKTITLWYTIFLVALATALLLLLLSAQAVQEKALVERELMQTVADVSEKVGDDPGALLGSSRIKFYQKDTYISLYDETGYFLVGRRPSSLAEFPEFSDRTAVTVEDVNGIKWYVYDSLYDTEDSRIWIRGMMRHIGHGRTDSFLLHFLLVALPIFILLAALGGLAITRRAFRPLREIIRTTEEIRADADISRRIPKEDSPEELRELSASINGMFDRIENVIDQEKQFASDVSHELRTPIAVIRSQSEYALEDPGYSGKALLTIHRQAGQMGNLVNRLLTLSRSDAGTLRLQEERISFSDLLSDIAEQQQMAAEDQDVEITAELEPDVFVIADEDMLIRVVLNLMTNAICYGRTPVPEGSSPKSPAGFIRVTLRSEQGYALCTVADRGPGIPKDEQEKIWNRFYQIDRARSAESGEQSSAGLGLSMVQALTKAMGGTVSLESEEGRGAAFTIRLPLAPR